MARVAVDDPDSCQTPCCIPGRIAYSGSAEFRLPGLSAFELNWCVGKNLAFVNPVYDERHA